MPKSFLTSQQKMTARIEAGNSVVDALHLAASNGPVAEAHELKCLAARISLCNHPANSWLVRDATSETSTEKFDAVGRFWRCGNKLCPDCIARQARKTRKALRTSLAEQTLRAGERYYFITFTIPNPSLDLAMTRSLVDYAWSLFRKRSLCVSLIRGGAKSEEFTLTTRGYHYHIHLLALSKFLLFSEVRRTWTDCVKASFKKHAIAYVNESASGEVRVNVKLVHGRDGRPARTPQSLESAVQEVCKYITKSDSWRKMSQRDLASVALIKRWNRMFELIGSFRLATTEEPQRPEANVHTRLLSDGGSEPSQSYWRDSIRSLNLDDYQAKLLDEFHAVRAGRWRQLELRYLTARIVTFDELANAKGEP